MRHFVIVGVLIAILTPLIYLGLRASNLMPIEASLQSIPVDWMWNMDMGPIAFLFALIMVPLVYSLIVFRRRKGDTTDAENPGLPAFRRSTSRVPPDPAPTLRRR